MIKVYIYICIAKIKYKGKIQKNNWFTIIDIWCQKSPVFTSLKIYSILRLSWVCIGYNYNAVPGYTIQFWSRYTLRKSENSDFLKYLQTLKGIINILFYGIFLSDIWWSPIYVYIRKNSIDIYNHKCIYISGEAHNKCNPTV